MICQIVPTITWIKIERKWQAQTRTNTVITEQMTCFSPYQDREMLSVITALIVTKKRERTCIKSSGFEEPRFKYKIKEKRTNTTRIRN